MRTGGTHRRRQLRAVLVAAIVALVTAAIPDALADQQIVAPQGAAASGYSNPQVTIAQGEHVTLRNDDPTVNHNVTAKDNGSDGKPLFQSATIGGGQTAPVTGAESLKPGTYNFYCTLHPYTMTGTLTVTASSSTPSGGGGSSGGGGTGSSGSGSGGGGSGTAPKKSKKSKKHNHKRKHRRRKGRKH